MINFLSLIAFIILLVVLFLLLLWMWSSIRAKVPFVTIPSKTLSEIEKALNINENSVVYDLGCGDGRVLFYLHKHNPKAKYIGIENSPFPFLLASVRNWWHKRKYKSGIVLLKKDFFTKDLSDATHIFTYLYPNVMDDLLPKFDKEFKRGTKLVSASFCFTTKRDAKEIDLHRGKYQLARKIYVYEF